MIVAVNTHLAHLANLYRNNNVNGCFHQAQNLGSRLLADMLYPFQTKGKIHDTEKRHSALLLL